MDAIGLIQSFLGNGQYRILMAGSSEVVPSDAVICIIIVSTCEIQSAGPRQAGLVLTRGSEAKFPFTLGTKAYITFTWSDTGITATPASGADHTFWEHIWLG